MFVDEANHIYIAMPMYNLTEYSNNYSDTLGRLWQFKRDEVPDNNADLIFDNSQPFKYKVALAGKTKDTVGGTNSSVKDAKIVVPLKYLSKFWRSLEMPLIKCKVYLELNWIEDCSLSSDGDSAKFEITDAKLHVPIVTLSTKDSTNLTKQLSKGFKRPVYWNSYETRPAEVIEQGKNLYKLLNASIEGLKRLFVLTYAVTAGANADEEAGTKGNKSIFFQEEKLKIDGKNFHDQPIHDLIKQYDEFRKVLTGYGDDYTTGFLLNYAYFKDNYKLIAVDLSKEKTLDADPRAIQQTVFQGIAGRNNGTKIRLYTNLEQSKETMLEFSKVTAKML